MSEITTVPNAGLSHLGSVENAIPPPAAQATPKEMLATLKRLRDERGTVTALQKRAQGVRSQVAELQALLRSGKAKGLGASMLQRQLEARQAELAGLERNLATRLSATASGPAGVAYQEAESGLQQMGEVTQRLTGERLQLKQELAQLVSQGHGDGARAETLQARLSAIDNVVPSLAPAVEALTAQRNAAVDVVALTAQRQALSLEIARQEAAPRKDPAGLQRLHEQRERLDKTVAAMQATLNSRTEAARAVMQPVAPDLLVSLEPLAAGQRSEAAGIEPGGDETPAQGDSTPASESSADGEPSAPAAESQATEDEE